MRTMHLGWLVLLLGACGGSDKSTQAGGGAAPASAPAQTPEIALRKKIADTRARPEHVDPRVKVEHILISFAGLVPGATRTREQAETLAAQLLAQIEKGADFSALRNTNSDDTGGGVYAMVVGSPAEGELLRTRMVPAFGDVGWRLKVGEIGVAGFDPATSPYGWHIIKRIE